MKYFKRFNTAMEDGLSKSVFEHLRNYLMCSLLLVVGLAEWERHTNLFFGLIPSNYSGAGIVGVSCILICLNLYDGIRKISKSKYHSLLILLLIIIYVLLSVRVIELAWSFRASSQLLCLTRRICTGKFGHQLKVLNRRLGTAPNICHFLN